ncbi:hypothetical protein CBR_g16053 [Chara braunii]|uniref:Uncharacterized protein n=1 Tax=Chara braunii TaxID=69332 RepID=A0A388JT13_CHABU|nr:hypothetical protein CBR_g16053 [Chara braunii]|eukprot:GBG60931.1 hypothetical protein CBR_g16053 [Chara braunii]
MAEKVVGRGGRFPPSVPETGGAQGGTEDDERIIELVRLCYTEGIIPPDIDPGEMTMDGRVARFKVNVAIDRAKVNWLKQHTVTIIFKEGAKFLPKKIKEDIVRAYEDERVHDDNLEVDTFHRGRVKIESPNVVSYVAKNPIIALWMVSKGHNSLTMGASECKLEFKPWLTKAQLAEQRRIEDHLTFWVIAVQVPLEAMLCLEAQIKKAIGPVVRRHPTEPDRQRPTLVNVKFDLEPSARPNMKDVLRIETFEGDQLEVKLASSETPKCRRCRAFFHTKDQCRRAANQPQSNHGGDWGGGNPLSYDGPMAHPGTSARIDPALSGTTTPAPGSPMQGTIQQSGTLPQGGIHHGAVTQNGAQGGVSQAVLQQNVLLQAAAQQGGMPQGFQPYVNPMFSPAMDSGGGGMGWGAGQFGSWLPPSFVQQQGLRQFQSYAPYILRGEPSSLLGGNLGMPAGYGNLGGDQPMGAHEKATGGEAEPRSAVPEPSSELMPRIIVDSPEGGGKKLKLFIPILDVGLAAGQLEMLETEGLRLILLI